MALAGIITVVVLVGWFIVEGQIELRRKKNARLTQTNIAPPRPYPPRPLKSTKEFEAAFNKIKEIVDKNSLELSDEEIEQFIVSSEELANAKKHKA